MPQKILVIRFSSIGDIVLTTPVIRSLSQQLGAEVHLLTKRSFAGVLGDNPYIHKVWALNKQLGPLLKALKQEQFTAIVDLHNNLRSWRVKWTLWRVKAYTFDKLNWQKWLLTRWKINRLPSIHIVDRYLAAAQPLGIHNDGQGLDLFIPNDQSVNPSDYQLPKRFIALVVGAAHATKRLPLDQLQRLCTALPYPIALLGGPDDTAVGTALAAAHPNKVINLCGELRLLQSADILRQATLVITHDTGLMHMAAALQKPILSVWGNTIPEFGMYPYLPDSSTLNQQLEVLGLPCRPCSKIGHDTCPQGHFSCMLQHNIQAIAQQAIEFVSQ